MRTRIRFCKYCSTRQEHEYQKTIALPKGEEKEILVCRNCGRITMEKKNESENKEAGKTD